jgi:hypothetical protein
MSQGQRRSTPKPRITKSGRAVHKNHKTDEQTNEQPKAVPVSLAPLDMETAVRALLATKPAKK